jgi:hypothetical protein
MKVAHYRELQSQGRLKDKRRRIGNGFAAPANTNGNRQPGKETAQAIHIHSERNASPFESARHRVSMQTYTTNNGWWANEPGVGRMVHGMAHRNDRIAAIGDGQVPAVVKLAWETLI